MTFMMGFWVVLLGAVVYIAVRLAQRRRPSGEPAHEYAAGPTQSVDLGSRQPPLARRLTARAVARRLRVAHVGADEDRPRRLPERPRQGADREVRRSSGLVQELPRRLGH